MSSGDRLFLNCWIVRDDLDGVFTVETSSQSNVSLLREKIWEKNLATFSPVPARKLKLFKISVPENEFETTLGPVTSPSDIPEAVKLTSLTGLSTLFNAQPAQNHIHIMVQCPSADESTISPSTSSESNLAANAAADGKRKREDPVDVSKQLLDKWNVPLPTIPNLTDLEVYLDAPLEPAEKIPISDLEWRTLLREDPLVPQHACYPNDLEFLFTKNEDETSSLFLHSMHEAIIRGPPAASGTEDSFHAFWDRNILDILLKCFEEPLWVRNSNKGTNTGSHRPDLGLLLHGTCIFRGEEKKPTFSGKHPLQELADKTRWLYDPAPYVLGYHAVGADATIVAIQPRPDAQGVDVTEIVYEDLSTRRGRIKNAARIIRLVKVLRGIERIVGKGLDVDMLPMIRDDGKSIEFLKTKIRKSYSSEDKARVSFLKYIYGHLKAKGVPNVDNLTKLEISSRGCFVELEPRGNDKGPRSAGDVTNAVISILEALQVLHTSEPQIFHRDIRWPNVMQSITDPTKWFLIDWEDAATAPTKAASNLRPEIHAPQVFQDGHGAEVDIWGVGRLIATANISNLPGNLLSLGQKMVEGSVVSAEQALEELKLL